MVLVAHPKKRKLTPHAQKRQGGHHRQSRHYSKTYWPYLTMLSVILCGFIFNSLWTPSRQVLGYTSDLTPVSLLQNTNQARLADGDTPLSLNSKLSAAAQAKADDMAKRNYWSHATPEGNQPWHFAQRTGYGYTTLGENLAYGFDGSAATVNAWLNSPEHRANVLGNDFRDIGVGVATAKQFQGRGETTIVVAMYGAPHGSGAVTPPSQGVLPTRTVSRLETISTAQAALITALVAVVAASGTAFVALKHGRLLRRTLIKGEVFIVRHHLLDVTFLAIGAVGFVITRSAGVIH